MNDKRLFMRTLETVSNVKYISYYIAMVGLIVALIFSFIVYPIISTPFHAGLDPDHYGALGYGIWKLGNFSYYPDTQPSVIRGPFYPLFEAFCLMITNGWWPQSVQLGQCILFALTCFLVFWISKALWGNKVAVLTSLICAFHPFVLWYTSRIWIETLATFLFTSIIAGVLYLKLKPSKTRCILLGCILAVSALCKQTFLLYILFIPLFLGIMRNGKINRRFIICTPVVALIIILPWTIRNWRLTGKFIPIHAYSGAALFWGDLLVENYTKSPFSAANNVNDSIRTAMFSVEQTIPENMERWEEELFLDSRYFELSIERYRKNPTFVFTKIICNAVMFWTLGESNLKSAVIASMQIPLLFFFIWATIEVIKQKKIFTILGGNILFVWLYFMLHLPIVAAGRYSVVLIPTMLTSLGVLIPKLHEKDEAYEK